MRDDGNKPRHEVLLMSKFRPLLAAQIETEDQLSLLQYPLIASPKVDGIRVLIHPELGPVTRSLKAVHNRHIYSILNKPELYGLDGEVCVGPNAGPGVFARTTTAVMSYDGEPQFTYHVFDDFTSPTDPYHARLVSTRIKTIKSNHPNVEVLESVRVIDPEEILIYEQSCLELGFEGIMLRHTHGHYKFNRSTFTQQILLKLKRFKDDEATITGFQELLRNRNAPTENHLGLTDRSDHKANMEPAGTLGSITVAHVSFGVFSIGSGFDAALRDHIWANRDAYVGKQVNFRYQEVGVVSLPRFPIFKGFREIE
jgi:DNA ligase-1